MSHFLRPQGLGVSPEQVSSSYPCPPLRYLPSLRTLLLHNNQLSFLPAAVFSALPSLQEVSLHSNPLRCDCCSSWGPHLGNQSHLKLQESPTTLCSSPHRLAGRELREVVAAGCGAGTGGDGEDGGTSSCLPQISPYSFPPAVNVSAGQPITLECWAEADPAPQFYWVTPTGDKVRGGGGLVGRRTLPLTEGRSCCAQERDILAQNLEEVEILIYPSIFPPSRDDVMVKSVPSTPLRNLFVCYLVLGLLVNKPSQG